MAAGWFVTWWAGRFPARELHGYSLLFLGGVAVGLLSLYFVWNFAIALATPFFTVYVLQRLGYGMGVVVALAVLSQLANVVFVRVWGRLADRFTNKGVLGVSGPLVLASVFLWLFTAMPDPYRFTLPILIAIHVLLGVSMAGVTLATGNIGLKLAPRGRATAYLAVNGLVGSLAAAVGPLVGGALSVDTLVVEGLDFVFLGAVLAGIYAVHRLAMVVEAGRLERDALVRSLLDEVTQPLGSFTTVGVTDLFHAPMGALDWTRRAVRAAGRRSRRKRE